MKRLTALALALLLVLSLCACGNKEPEIVEVINEIEKIVEVEVPVEVEKIVEVPVEVEKIVEVPVEVEKIVEVPVEVEKIVEVSVDVEKTVEVNVEHMNTTYNEIPVSYTRKDIIEMSGIEIPAGFTCDYEGSPVYLFYLNGYSPLRSSPEALKTNIICYIYYYFQTELNRNEEGAPISTRATVSHDAVLYGSWGDYSLVLWNGRFGWIESNAISPYPMGNGNRYDYDLSK